MDMMLIDEVIPAKTVPTGMVRIPAGAFRMGSEDGSPAERPVHEVWVDEFALDETPVTNEQFAAFVASTGHLTTLERLLRIARREEGETSLQGQSASAPTWRTHATAGRAEHPVVLVSWHDADAYAKCAGKRLPTEAEWEKAARGGLNQKKFPWGDESPRGRARWEQVTVNFGLAPTSAVKSFDPNAFGVYDMAGNTWEWCLDWYSESYYALGASTNPGGPESGPYRVRRGASWNVREDFRLRCANRGAMPPDRSWPNLGFRCAFTP